MAYIEFQHVKKFYGKKNEAVIKALDDTNFSVEEGELAVILGASGAGKTTALNILGGMDQATEGEVIVAGKHLNRFSEKTSAGNISVPPFLPRAKPPAATI